MARDEVTRARVQELEADQLLQDMEPGAARIAEIVPEVRVKLPDLAAPPEMEPEQARIQLFDSMTTFLAKTSLSQPLVLVLEGLHWADTSSLRIKYFSPVTYTMGIIVKLDKHVLPRHPGPHRTSFVILGSARNDSTLNETPWKQWK